MNKNIFRRFALILISALLTAACGAFAEPALSPDESVGVSKYADPENWAYYGVGEDKDADIFIVAPTVDMKSEYNMVVDDKNKSRLTRALNMQKDIYEDNLRMFSPYYAQISFKAYCLTDAEREPYMDIAYSDLSEAFSYYLAHENQGRPIVLFGYSQGGYYIYRLLKDFFGDAALYQQLVAAYAIGWGCSPEEAERYPQIVPAAGEDDIGCVVSYDAEAPDVAETLIVPRGERRFAINPLNWKTDATPADRTQNKGAVFVTNDLEVTEVAQFCGAYHLYFFWNNLKDNVGVRLAAYQSRHQG